MDEVEKARSAESRLGSLRGTYGGEAVLSTGDSSPANGEVPPRLDARKERLSEKLPPVRLKRLLRRLASLLTSLTSSSAAVVRGVSTDVGVGCSPVVEVRGVPASVSWLTGGAGETGAAVASAAGAAGASPAGCAGSSSAGSTARCLPFSAALGAREMAGPRPAASAAGAASVDGAPAVGASTGTCVGGAAGTSTLGAPAAEGTAVPSAALGDALGDLVSLPRRLRNRLSSDMDRPPPAAPAAPADASLGSGTGTGSGAGAPVSPTLAELGVSPTASGCGASSGCGTSGILAAVSDGATSGVLASVAGPSAGSPAAAASSACRAGVLGNCDTADGLSGSVWVIAGCTPAGGAEAQVRASLLGFTSGSPGV